jgi:hypothetical protein
MWRALSEAGDLQLARVNAAVTRFRRHWWGILAGRPERFPWLRVAGRELTGITVVDLDASIVFAASDKENAAVMDAQEPVAFRMDRPPPATRSSTTAARPLVSFCALADRSQSAEPLRPRADLGTWATSRARSVKSTVISRVLPPGNTAGGVVR